MRLLLLAICMVATTFLFSQNTNIQQPTSVNADGAAPDASAILDVQATDKGLLTPRMATSQRTAIAAPAPGLLVYDTDTGSFWFFENNNWNELASVMPPSESGTNPTGIPIPDCNPTGISSVISLTGTDTVAADTRFRVCMDIMHSFTPSLDISLQAPDGTSIDLSSDNGPGVNYTGTCFSTEATSPITGGTPPFSGNWQPEEPFSAFTGKAIAGDWVLNVVDDDCLLEMGQLENWSLNISRPSTVATLLADTDGDTRISAEDLPDEDIVRLEAGGMAGLEIRPDSSVFSSRLRVLGNFVSGNTNSSTGFDSFAGGGTFNEATGSRSFVGGGASNNATGFLSFVGGGQFNEASGSRSFAGGGFSNTASGTNSFVGSGFSNEASGDHSFVGGGRDLLARSYSEAVFGTYNTDYTPASTSSSNPADRLFVIGNGMSSGTRSNAVTVLKNGNVGIGSSSPPVKLSVAGGSDASLMGGGYIQTGVSSSLNLVMDQNEIMARNNGAPSSLFLNIDGGNVKIGNSASKLGIGADPVTNQLEVYGTASKTSAGDWLANSDARLKTNIRPLDSEDVLQKMLSLQGVTYEWADDQTGSQRPEGTMYGFTAQNIQQVFPGLVTEDNLGFLQTAYGTYDAMTVEAMRALKNEIEALKAEVADLQSRLAEMDE